MGARTSVQILAINRHCTGAELFNPPRGVDSSLQAFAERHANPPNPYQILPNSHGMALLASATCRYNELANGLNALLGEDILPDAQYVALERALADSPLMSPHRKDLIPEGLLRHPPRSLPIFTLHYLRYSVLVSRTADHVLSVFKQRLSVEAKRMDIRHLTAEHLRRCVRTKDVAERANLQALVVVIAVTGAGLDALRVAHPDRMEAYSPPPDQARGGRSRVAAMWHSLARANPLRLH